MTFKKSRLDLGFAYISKRQSDFAISRGFHFHETLHVQNFTNIEPSGKFPNLQDWIYKTRWKKEIRGEAAKHLISFCNKVNQVNIKYRSINVTHYF